jgi:hypothetical protein
MNPTQRRQQLGRIHAAKRQLELTDDGYRDLLESLTGLRSAADLTDGQINHVLDWLAYLAGWRVAQPRSFGPRGSAQPNLARVCKALANVIPPGFSRPPLGSDSWVARTARCDVLGTPFEDMTVAELTRLLEAIKAISRRAGQRRNETLDELPIGGEMGPADPGREPAPF